MKTTNLDKELLGDKDYCTCDETLLQDPETRKVTRVKKPRWHDCGWIRLVNSTIPDNCVVADRLTETMPESTQQEKESKKAAWQQAFSRHMDHSRTELLLQR